MSVDRVVAEIWRACQSQPDPIMPDLTSSLVFSCQQQVRQDVSQSQLVSNLNRLLFTSKANTLVAEFAKRAAVSSAGRDDPAQAWREQFFGQITDYLASRDLSGYVGPRFRNQNVLQLLEFKQALREHVRQTVSSFQHAEPQTPASWRSYVRQIVRVLAQTRP